MTRKTLAAAACLLALTLTLVAGPPATWGQDKTRIKVAALTLPVSL